jgi:hypothetical protein
MVTVIRVLSALARGSIRENAAILPERHGGAAWRPGFSIKEELMGYCCANPAPAQKSLCISAISGFYMSAAVV